jgi:adenylyltransferase/sulfurtransferase
MSIFRRNKGRGEIVMELDPRSVKDWLDQDLIILVDVREYEELVQFSIPGAVHNAMSAFDVDLISAESDKKLVFFCAHGIRSKQVGQFLIQENHVSEAYNMTGGVAAWIEAGLPGQI